MAKSSNCSPTGSYRGFPRQPFPRCEPLRHPRQARHNTAKRHTVGPSPTCSLGCACLSCNGVVLTDTQCFVVLDLVLHEIGVFSLRANTTLHTRWSEFGKAIATGVLWRNRCSKEARFQDCFCHHCFLRITTTCEITAISPVYPYISKQEHEVITARVRNVNPCQNHTWKWKDPCNTM